MDSSVSKKLACVGYAGGVRGFGEAAGALASSSGTGAYSVTPNWVSGPIEE